MDFYNLIPEWTLNSIIASAYCEKIDNNSSFLGVCIDRSKKTFGVIWCQWRQKGCHLFDLNTQGIHANPMISLDIHGYVFYYGISMDIHGKSW